jgi:hypothetical protein
VYQVVGERDVAGRLLAAEWNSRPPVLYPSLLVTQPGRVLEPHTLPGFASWNIAAVGAGKKYDRPTEVIDAKVAKLG